MKVKARRRKLPVTSSSSRGSSNALPNKPNPSASAKPRSSARVIRRFHVLLKCKMQLERTLRKHTSSADVQKDEQVPLQRKRLELEKVENEVEKLGGLEAYQRMSKIGQGKDRGGGSERVFIEWLKELNVRGEEILSRRRRRRRQGKGKEKLRLLEVGALKPDNYASCNAWIDVLSIDLRSTHPGIVEKDFLQMDLADNRGTWDAISLSLVLNFVPEPKDRGRMLRLAHGMLRNDGGLLFLALPLPCVSNSRYLTFEHLTQLMAHVGFQSVRERWKEGGKMSYWLFKKTEVLEKESDGKGARFNKKLVLREGNRNNFCILL